VRICYTIHMTAKIVVGNWKMNPTARVKAKDVYQKNARAAQNLKKARAVLCVPYVYLDMLHNLSGAPRLALGVQDVFYEKEGSRTGEISVPMVKDLGTTHVIVGHSERRVLGEDTATVAKKARAVVANGLTAVVCVGEHERDEDGVFYDTLSEEIIASLHRVEPAYFTRLIVAYEPLWAIGKSAEEAMSGAQMSEMAIFIRKVITDAFGADAAQALSVIYGGSVDASNAQDIIENGRIAGVLPGRASCNPKEFAGILHIADELS